MNESLSQAVVHVPSKTSSAGPVMMTLLSRSRHSISSGPPGSSTVHFLYVLPSSTAATTVAHAPVPHARVAPAPRSHTCILT